MATTEVITLSDIQNRTEWEYNYIKSGYPLSGYEDVGGPPTASVTSSNTNGVTLTVSTHFEGRLCQPEFRFEKDIKVLAKIMANLGSVNHSGPTKFVVVSETDEEPDYLESKLIDGDGVLVTKVSESNDSEYLQLDVRVKNSVETDSDQIQLVNDELAPGNSYYYGTNATGTKGWYDFTENDVRVAVSATDTDSEYLGDKIVDGDGVSITTLTDGLGVQTLSFAARVKNSVETDSDQIQFVNDSSAPGNSKFYGTTTAGVKGWQSLPIKNSIEEDSSELQFVNDSLAPGNSKFYGTTVGGVKGWQPLPIKNSIELDSEQLQLVNDAASPGNTKFYATTSLGVKGWQSLPVTKSIEQDSGNFQLVNDATLPGLQRYYGTDSSGTKGYYSLPAAVAGQLFSEGSIDVVAEIDSAGDADYTMSLVNDENSPGLYRYYGTDENGSKGWHGLEQLPNEIGLGGDPDEDSIAAIDFPVLRRCSIDTADGTVSTIGTAGDDIILSGDGVTPDQQIIASKIWNAVWNDIVDFQKLDGKLRHGKCYYDSITGAKICDKRCQKSVIGIASDTFGFALGIGNGKVPIAVTGWVLAYVDKEYEMGTPLTNDNVGNLTEMTLKEKQNYPERIVAIYKKKETATSWGFEGLEIKVNGRHWIKVK